MAKSQLITGSGGGSPSVPFNSIQYNNAGSFFGDALATRDPATGDTLIAAMLGPDSAGFSLTPTNASYGYTNGAQSWGINASNNSGGELVIRSNTDTYIWPQVDGALGETLTTDGAGTLSWTAAGGGGGITSVPVGQSIFVSQITGNDGTGTRGRFDLMYKTIEAAILAYQFGDTIYVYPGTYNLSGTINTPAMVTRMHFYNGAVVNGFPQLPVMLIGGGLVITGDGEFTSQGVAIGAYGVFQVNPTVPGDVYIECKKITGSDHGVLILSGSFIINIIIEIKERFFAANTGLDISGSHTVNIISDIIANLAVDNKSNGLVRFRGSRMTSAASNPAYQQLSLANVEFYNCTFVSGPGATYSLTTNIASNVKLYSTSVANKNADPNITFLVNSPLVVDSNVS